MRTYKTRKEAQDRIENLDSQNYHLAHGEYAIPHYTARKVRGKDLFYIHAVYWFFEGTLYPKKDGALKV